MYGARLATLSRRADEGRLVDGHGDLRCEHVVRLASGWGVIDGIEFSGLLRSIDPLSDAAFLSMDLASMERRDLAEAFLKAYLADRPDPDAPELRPLYLAYRALSEVDASAAA